MTISGRVKFDAFGRTTAQYYPVSPEPVGQAGAFSEAYDNEVLPTVTEYDVLDRVTKTTLPDQSVTTLTYGFAPDRNSVTQFETLVRDANANDASPEARPGAVKSTYRNVRDLITSVKELHRDPSTQQERCQVSHSNICLHPTGTVSGLTFQHLPSPTTASTA